MVTEADRSQSEQAALFTIQREISTGLTPPRYTATFRFANGDIHKGHIAVAMATLLSHPSRDEAIPTEEAAVHMFGIDTKQTRRSTITYFGRARGILTQHHIPVIGVDDPASKRQRGSQTTEWHTLLSDQARETLAGSVLTVTLYEAEQVTVENDNDNGETKITTASSGPHIGSELPEAPVPKLADSEARTLEQSAERLDFNARALPVTDTVEVNTPESPPIKEYMHLFTVKHEVIQDDVGPRNSAQFSFPNGESITGNFARMTALMLALAATDGVLTSKEAALKFYGNESASSVNNVSALMVGVRARLAQYDITVANSRQGMRREWHAIPGRNAQTKLAGSLFTIRRNGQLPIDPALDAIDSWIAGMADGSQTTTVANAATEPVEEIGSLGIRTNGANAAANGSSARKDGGHAHDNGHSAAPAAVDPVTNSLSRLPLYKRYGLVLQPARTDQYQRRQNQTQVAQERKHELRKTKELEKRYAERNRTLTSLADTMISLLADSKRKELTRWSIVQLKAFSRSVAVAQNGSPFEHVNLDRIGLNTKVAPGNAEDNMIVDERPVIQAVMALFMADEYELRGREVDYNFENDMPTYMQLTQALVSTLDTFCTYQQAYDNQVKDGRKLSLAGVLRARANLLYKLYAPELSAPRV